MTFPTHFFPVCSAIVALHIAALSAVAIDKAGLPPNSWVKLSPLDGAPPSPRLGYEGACVWDSKHRVLIRYGGHNQGGGGEQHSEIWTFDPATAKWTLKEPNIQPPGICCGQQNVFDPSQGRYLRFPSFSGSHGWQWFREIYLNDASVWSYDLAENRWRNLRPYPTASPKPLRCAAWDSTAGVAVIFGGETSQEGTLVYDPHRNIWTHQRPKPEPAGRSGGSLAYDAARRRHILFGAQFIDDPHTWAYDLEKNRWTRQEPPTHPPTNKNDAVMAYDTASRLVLAIVRVSGGEGENAKSHLETWTYDAGANRWTKLNPPREPDPSGSRARNLVFAPELGVFLLENRTHPPTGPAEQQIWALRLEVGKSEAKPEKLETPVPSPKGPRIVEDVVVSVLDAKRTSLKWKPSPAAGIAGYHVERAPVEVASEDQLRRLKKQTDPLPDPSVGGITKVGTFQRLTIAPLKEPAFTDTAIDLSQPRAIAGEPVFEKKWHVDQYDPSGKPYRFAVFAYRVIAVTTGGEESGPSAAELTIPSPVQWLLAKEDGATCQLKWAANPQQSLRGYRVYRMDGRYDKDGIPRLTPEPVTSTNHADPAAGERARRYYVVAVDALGQEGFPSSPVWFQREWKPFYEPFTGEWHQ